MIIIGHTLFHVINIYIYIDLIISLPILAKLPEAPWRKNTIHIGNNELINGVTDMTTKKQTYCLHDEEYKWFSRT
jgi:hypothetical protein